ncbi:SusE domain-containing protein [Ferruginibacter sp. SUN002]|uniref:SusE domain-containing protein n=1 Tax=Ferruginibacter sp. SUN002 TaxID=2937789 RepID=UPI003D36B18D
MKRLFNNIFILGICSVLLFSCKKDDANQVTLLSGEAPVLSGTTNTTTSDIALAKANVDKPALDLTWTNPNYKFSDGISSQDVNYTIEVDVEGSDFANAKEVDVVAKNLGSIVTQGKLNFALTKSLGLLYGKSYNIEIRVIARIGQGKKPEMISNKLSFTATPYLDVAVPLPTAGTLWVTGNAFASNWSNPLGAPYDVTQKFTQVSETLYELTVEFIGGGGYKLIQEQGVWGSQYHALDGTAALSGSFEKKDADPQFPSPGAGWYKISVDFITGKYTLTKL